LQGLNGLPTLAPSSPPEASSEQPINSSLRPFLNQAVYGTQVLDYSVDPLSEPTQEGPSQTRDAKQPHYVSTIYLRRRGDFVLPITAEILFDDGTRMRERWDGADRWTRFTYTRNAKVLSVELDPDHAVPLDRDLFNNSFTTRANPVPARKLTSIWAILQQFAAQLAAWIV
jgi:hypothetical protein